MALERSSLPSSAMRCPTFMSLSFGQVRSVVDDCMARGWYSLLAVTRAATTGVAHERCANWLS